METVTVEGISKTSVDQHQMFEISKCGTNAEHENIDERIDSEVRKQNEIQSLYNHRNQTLTYNIYCIYKHDKCWTT